VTGNPAATRFRRKRAAFTLIELLVVMAIIATLLSLAVPRYFSSVDRAKEAVLKENLRVLREAIDKFHADNGRYPDTIEVLATRRYLRGVPVDPITESATTWVVLGPPESGSANSVYDVKSGAVGTARDGTEYASW
jgi:general secretion pathway protein G